MTFSITRILLVAGLAIASIANPAFAKDKKAPDPNKPTTVSGTITATDEKASTVSIEVKGKGKNGAATSHVLTLVLTSTITVDHHKAVIADLKNSDPVKVTFTNHDIVTLEVTHGGKGKGK